MITDDSGDQLQNLKLNTSPRHLKKKKKKRKHESPAWISYIYYHIMHIRMPQIFPCILQLERSCYSSIAQWNFEIFTPNDNPDSVFQPTEEASAGSLVQRLFSCGTKVPDRCYMPQRYEKQNKTKQTKQKQTNKKKQTKKKQTNKKAQNKKETNKGAMWCRNGPFLST